MIKWYVQCAKEEITSISIVFRLFIGNSDSCSVHIDDGHY